EGRLGDRDDLLPAAKGPRARRLDLGGDVALLLGVFDREWPQHDRAIHAEALEFASGELRQVIRDPKVVDLVVVDHGLSSGLFARASTRPTVPGCHRSPRGT